MNEKLKKLFAQIIKFGIVGVIATVIDWVIFYICTNVFNIHYAISTVIGFSISAIFNYLASVKWVFNVSSERDSRKNFIFFITFSIIGLLLNELIVWFTIEKLDLYNMIGKVLATAIVMVFNFVTRKIFLEDNDYGKK